MAPNTGAECATCGDAATNKCGGCKTYVYCGRECQAKAWPEHKITCKDVQLEKHLSRAAEIAHQAYLTFREDTWDTPIAKIEDTEDALIIYDGDQSLNKDYFVDFPHHLIKNRRAKMAILSMMMCNEPLAWMHNLLQGLVGGLRVHIDEIQVDLRSIPRKAIAVLPNGSRLANWPTPHAMVRFTSVKTKTQWILDFAGGQYGICQPLWKWSEYAKCFVNPEQALRVCPFGATKALLGVLGELDGNPSLIYGLVGEVAKVMDKAVADGEKGMSFVVSSIVHEPDENRFNEQKSALLKALHVAARHCVQTHSFQDKIQAARAFDSRFPGRSFVTSETVKQQFSTRYAAMTEQPL